MTPKSIFEEYMHKFALNWTIGQQKFGYFSVIKYFGLIISKPKINSVSLNAKFNAQSQNFSTF